MGSSVRGRFAPTPSGYMHIGNALSAILAWLQVRCLHGEFILRIEDLDVERFDPRYVDALMEDLKWLGVDWDEGPDVPGPYGPYRQQDRAHLYEQAFAALKAKDLLYPCFCSRKDLRTPASAPHGLTSEGPVYSGSCRYLSNQERARRAVQKPPAWRFMLPHEGMTFHDLVQGPKPFPPGAGGDFIVYRADGVFSYQLAVVVDDAKMRITHVLRGDDLLDSTPRQLYLYRALGLTPPSFAHIPMVCSASGARLAKRDNSITVRSLREQGVSPERVVGYLAWLAGLIVRPEAVRLCELIPDFDLSRVVHQPILLQKDWLETLLKGKRDVSAL
ncbi:tRNA glutamyl-Q(34) synthetase GluQRS [Alicyclobacillus mengziensis]|uniref:Glutamyl-Q tRNA(Asp) synthetase n=1 Tax=Alicyclobacillus mengziensis TaxID=2931921 RepID=A0A9X7W1G1_9BACL|nr:tRNA glutamyl-Q(34) synthetase GluQRS [Alicyclobacillus mengziensis]QSO48569.1 tRNA glutamyl-Q(34) synthetase GluQRS [Alicyclobacillus mengziensis]